MGLGDRSLATNLTGIINQRLVRRLCNKCKRELETTEKQQAQFAAAGVVIPPTLFEPVGCEECAGTGYHGLIGAFEVARVDDKLREAIVAKISNQEIEKLFRSIGVVDLKADALEKVSAGLIGYDEAVGIRWFA